MTIHREVNGQMMNFELTAGEIAGAHDEFVISFMQDTIQSDFDVADPDTAYGLACAAYDIYCKGDGLTEYESIETAYNEYRADLDGGAK